MKECQAQIVEYGQKFECGEVATKKLSITTIVPHLGNKEVTRSSYLCTKHNARKKSRHVYQVKHCGKKSTIIEEDYND